MTFAKYMKICRTFGMEQISDDCFGFRQFAFITWFGYPAAVCEKDLKKFRIEDEKFVYHSSSEDDIGGKYEHFKRSDEFPLLILLNSAITFSSVAASVAGQPWS